MSADKSRAETAQVLVSHCTELQTEEGLSHRALFSAFNQWIPLLLCHRRLPAGSNKQDKPDCWAIRYHRKWWSYNICIGTENRHENKAQVTRSRIVMMPSKSAHDSLQSSAKRLRPGLGNFVSAVAYHSCLSLPAAFTQPGRSLLADPCTLIHGLLKYTLASALSLR